MCREQRANERSPHEESGLPHKGRRGRGAIWMPPERFPFRPSRQSAVARLHERLTRADEGAEGVQIFHRGGRRGRRVSLGIVIPTGGRNLLFARDPNCRFLVATLLGMTSLSDSWRWGICIPRRKSCSYFCAKVGLLPTCAFAAASDTIVLFSSGCAS